MSTSIFTTPCGLIPCYPNGMARAVGRPREPGAKRTAVLIKMSAREKALLRERAQAEGKPLATYIRNAALHAGDL